MSSSAAALFDFAADDVADFTTWRVGQPLKPDEYLVKSTSPDKAYEHSKAAGKVSDSTYLAHKNLVHGLEDDFKNYKTGRLPNDPTNAPIRTKPDDYFERLKEKQEHIDKELTDWRGVEKAIDAADWAKNAAVVYKSSADPDDVMRNHDKAHKKHLEARDIHADLFNHSTLGPLHEQATEANHTAAMHHHAIYTRLGRQQQPVKQEPTFRPAEEHVEEARKMLKDKYGFDFSVDSSFDSGNVIASVKDGPKDGSTGVKDSTLPITSGHGSLLDDGVSSLFDFSIFDFTTSNISFDDSPLKTRAANWSRVALNQTRLATKEKGILDHAGLAHSQAEQGLHRAAALSHRWLSSYHGGKKDNDAQIAHKKAFEHHIKLAPPCAGTEPPDYLKPPVVSPTAVTKKAQPDFSASFDLDPLVDAPLVDEAPMDKWERENSQQGQPTLYNDPEEAVVEPKAEPTIKPTQDDDPESMVGLLHNAPEPETTPDDSVEKPQPDSLHVLNDAHELEETDNDQQKEEQQTIKALAKHVSTALSVLPEPAKISLKKSAPNVAFFATPDKLSEQLAKVSPEVRAAVANGTRFHAALLPPHGQLMIAGRKDDPMTEEIAAYKVAQASAGKLAASPQWAEAASKDLGAGQLTDNASVDPAKAWGDFGRLVYKEKVSSEALRQAYPTATAVWEGHGLIPKDNKGEMTELTELFKSKASIYDPNVAADVALSPKASALATYTRIGKKSLPWLRDNVEQVGDWFKKTLERVPAPLRMAATGLMRRMYFTYAIANQAAQARAKARGADPHQAKFLANALTAADAFLGSSQLVPIAAAGATAAAGASPMAALGVGIAAKFLPVGSLAYLVLTAGGKRSAVDTFKKASSKVRQALSKKPKNKDFEDDGDSMDILSNHLLSHPQDDNEMWLACFLSAMDETQGDVRLSCQIADECQGGGDGGADFTENDPLPPSLPLTTTTNSSDPLADVLGATESGQALDKVLGATEKGKQKKPEKAQVIAKPRELSPLGFYSNIHDALNNFTPRSGKASGDEYLAALKKPGFAGASNHAEAIGLHDYFKNAKDEKGRPKKSFTPEEVLGFVNERHTPFSEVDQHKLAVGDNKINISDLLAKKQKIEDTPDEELEHIHPERYGVYDSDGEGDYYDTAEEAERAADELNQEALDEELNQHSIEHEPGGVKINAQKLLDKLEAEHKASPEFKQKVDEKVAKHKIEKRGDRWYAVSPEGKTSSVSFATEGDAEDAIRKHVTNQLWRSSDTPHWDDLDQLNHVDGAEGNQTFEDEDAADKAVDDYLEKHFGDDWFEKQVPEDSPLHTWDEHKKRLNEMRALIEKDKDDDHYYVKPSQWARQRTKDYFQGEKYDTEEEAQEALRDHIADHFEYPWSYAQEPDEHYGEQHAIADPDEIREHLHEQVDREIADRQGGKHNKNAGPQYGNTNWQLPGPKSSWTPNEPSYNELHVTAPQPDIATKASWKDGHGNFQHVDNPVVRLRYNLRNDTEGNKVFHLDEIQGPTKSQQKNMPEHLRERMYDIGLKRAIVKAVDAGADKLTWTTGAQQADRYNVRHQGIERVEWVPELDDQGKPKVDRDAKGGVDREYGRIIGYDKKGNQKVSERLPHAHADTLDQAAGDEVADKLRTTLSNTEDVQKSSSVEGDQLEIFGHGHKKNYDEMIPSRVKNILRKAGARIETTTLKGGSEVHSIRLTPEVVALVKQGMTSFSSEERTPQGVVDLGAYVDGGSERNRPFDLNGVVGPTDKLATLVDLEEEDAPSPTTHLFHHSPSKNRESILKYGFPKRFSSLADPDDPLLGGTFLSNIARPGKKRDVFKVDVSKLPKGHVEDDWSSTPEDADENWYVVHHDIPPHLVTLHTPASSFSLSQEPYGGVADFAGISKVQRIINGLKPEFQDQDRGGRALKSTIKQGLEQGSHEVVERYFGNAPPEAAEKIRKKFVDSQLAYLANYVDDVYKGNVTALPSRNAMYANSLRVLQDRLLELKAKDKGAKFERRILGKGDENCRDCVRLARRGWVRFGTLPQIGETVCKVNCQCKFEYSYGDEKPK